MFKSGCTLAFPGISPSTPDITLGVTAWARAAKQHGARARARTTPQAPEAWRNKEGKFPTPALLISLSLNVGVAGLLSTKKKINHIQSHSKKSCQKRNVSLWESNYRRKRGKIQACLYKNLLFVLSGIQDSCAFPQSGSRNFYKFDSLIPKSCLNLHSNRYYGL